MGKRSNFERVERDFYPTPFEAVKPLLEHLTLSEGFVEPCAGNGDLINHLEGAGHICTYSSDITPQSFLTTVHSYEYLTDRMCAGADYIITNPPWDRKILHHMIDHFRGLRPTWLLFDADWMHTKQSSEYMKYCRKIVSVGRVKWIPDSKMTGKDNCAWYLFDKGLCRTLFVGR